MPTILEDYFDFSEPGEIRIQGHRVWLHHVLSEYLDGGMTLEDLCERFDTLSKEEILACLLYYHRNKEAVDQHLADLAVLFQQQREESEQRHGDWVAELRRRKAAIDTAQSRVERV